MYKVIFVAVGVFVLTVSWKCCLAADNGLAITPPMGWLSWVRFRCNIDCKNDPKNCISERLYMEMADRLVQDGFLDVGYQYVNIDDCWMARNRSADGRLVADPQRFPSGIKALADYMHKRGLKLGIYADFGLRTCAGYPGTELHLQVDAQTFAEWNVDSLKMDGCFANPLDMIVGFPKMAQYLNATGRPILFSCELPLYQLEPMKTVELYQLTAKYCNLWRFYLDIEDSWLRVSDTIKYVARHQDTLIQAQRPGAWNDPDMLVLGNFGLSENQQRTQMAMWAMFSAPLYMSNDLRRLPAGAKALLQNKRVIAVNQDRLGVLARLVHGSVEKRNVAVFTKPIYPRGAWAIVFTNADLSESWTGSLASLGLNNAHGYSMTELFSGKDHGTVLSNATLRVDVLPYDSVMFTAKPISD